MTKPKPQQAPEVSQALNTLGVTPDQAQHALDLGIDLSSLVRRLLAVLLEEIFKAQGHTGHPGESPK